MVLVYSFTPYYINYTRFLWNPNFQFSLLPILILLMGLYQKRPTKWRFFLISSTLGILFQFHYQFVIIFGFLFVYYFMVKKINSSNIAPFLGGIALGLSPLIVFDLRHNFYDVNTLILFLKNYSNLSNPGGTQVPHYYLSISFFVVIAIIGLLCAIAIPNYVRARACSQANACINNLRQIDGAMQQFAIENQKKVGDPVSYPSDLTPYIKLNSTSQIPSCPASGVYTVSAVGIDPSVLCSLGSNVTPPHTY